VALKSASAVKSDPQHDTFTIAVNDLSTLLSPTLDGTDAVWLYAGKCLILTAPAGCPHPRFSYTWDR
jgi:hypothetical protein